MKAFELPADLLETIEETGRRVEAENQQAARRARCKRLCGLAVLAVDSLREGSPKLRQEVEAAIHDVGAGVEALATFELAVRRYERPTDEQRRAAGAVIENAALGWALDNVEKLVRADAREREQGRKR